ncbi:tlde1 domain-containing protein [Flocculibacter collagenilyticus]|uniref:tlde1 domain-containing protein n=1 Tax=Flocculibacter collagenilyticus TaxID=2744479 RepID=UPI0018F44A3A|nr:tlde1 domain-containing protein [Flocculibacter collagenilyticus]
MKLIFSIESRRLHIQSSSFSFTIPATSGKGICQNNASKSCLKASWVGSIPLGFYSIRSSDLSDPNIAGDLYRNFRHGDWGDWRVKLTPRSSTKTFGRSGFFLHGGKIKGSAGCIDIGGGVTGSKETDLVRKMLLASGSVILEVRA